MILILGSTKDDVLYFESVMTSKRSEKIFNRYEAIYGNIFNQEIVLVTGVYTSYISTAIVSHLLSKHMIILVYSVGKCQAYSNDLDIGDIVVSKRVFTGDVDQVEESNSRLGQIPGFPFNFETQNDINGYMNNALDNRTLIPHKNVTFISSNTSYSNDRQLESIKVGDQIFGHHDNVVFDSISGGAAVACHMFNVPFIAVKVVSKRFKVKQNPKDYALVLKTYASVGKSIVTCIGDIGHNEVVRGREI